MKRDNTLNILTRLPANNPQVLISHSFSYWYNKIRRPFTQKELIQKFL